MALLRTVVALVALAGVAWAAVKAGDTLPDFRVDRFAGGALEKKDLAGKPAVVDFWASWCLPCRQALPALDALARRHGERVTVLAVGVDRDRDTATRFAAEILKTPALTLAHDGTGSLMQRLGAPAMPSVYVVDCAGVVRHVAAGWSKEKHAEIETQLDQVLRTPCG